MRDYSLIRMVFLILAFVIAFAPVVIYTVFSPYRQGVKGVFSSMWLWIFTGPGPAAVILDFFKASELAAVWMLISWLVGCIIAIKSIKKEREFLQR